MNLFIGIQSQAIVRNAERVKGAELQCNVCSSAVLRTTRNSAPTRMRISLYIMFCVVYMCNKYAALIRAACRASALSRDKHGQNGTK